jgi:hypothetical protein
VPGDDIIAHFSDKNVGDVDAIKGQLDGVPFYLFGMKEPDYTMIIMATYGTLSKLGPEKSVTTNLMVKKGLLLSNTLRLCTTTMPSAT